MAKKTGRRKMKGLTRKGASTVFLPDYLDQVKAIAMQGLSDDEMAALFGIRPELIEAWKEFYPSFAKAIEDGRTAADARVVQALFEKAIGHTLPETKVFYDREDGLIYADIERHVSPDLGAIKLWLTNRDKERWKDRSQVGVHGGKGDDAPVGVRDETKHEVMASILSLIQPHRDGPSTPDA